MVARRSPRAAAPGIRAARLSGWNGPPARVSQAQKLLPRVQALGVMPPQGTISIPWSEGVKQQMPPDARNLQHVVDRRLPVGGSPGDGVGNDRGYAFGHAV